MSTALQKHSIASVNMMLWLNTTLLSKQHLLINRAQELARKSKKLLPVNLNIPMNSAEIRSMKGLKEVKMKIH